MQYEEDLRGVDERREYFRIDDDVYLEYRLLDEGMAAEPLPSITTVPYSDNNRLARDLNDVSERLHVQLRNLKRKFPEVARCLTLMNEKVDLMMQLALKERPESEFQPNMRVNLSATGMAFPAPAALPEGSQVELTFKLFPSFKQVRTVARVIAVNQDTPDHLGRGFRVAVHYIEMKEDDREMLKDHALSKQLIRRRQRKR